MTKPFHKDELVARIQALVRRFKGHAQSAIEVDDLREAAAVMARIAVPSVALRWLGQRQTNFWCSKKWMASRGAFSTLVVSPKSLGKRSACCGITDRHLARCRGKKGARHLHAKSEFRLRWGRLKSLSAVGPKLPGGESHYARRSSAPMPQMTSRSLCWQTRIA